MQYIRFQNILNDPRIYTCIYTFSLSLSLSLYIYIYVYIKDLEKVKCRPTGIAFATESFTLTWDHQAKKMVEFGRELAHHNIEYIFCSVTKQHIQELVYTPKRSHKSAQLHCTNN